jgi:sarcosine oxidase
MGTSYDVVVVGLGGMGSATLHQLARRGKRVLGIERFDIGHAMGSSHGMTRILRLAYFEGSFYVPMVRRAVELWRETGARAGVDLFFETGSLDIAPAWLGIVENALRSCLDNDLPHDVLDARAINARFPAFALPGDLTGLFQPNGGFVASEAAILAHVALAHADGAEIRPRETFLEVSPRPGGDGVVVVTDAGRYEAERVVLSPGAWIGDLVPALKPRTTVIRQTLGWFLPQRAADLAMGRFPVFTLAVPEGHLYGFPLWGHPGFKLGSPHYGDDVFDPNTADRPVNPRHEEVLDAVTRRYIPAAAGPMLARRACLYTNTPDEHFVIDTLPGHPAIIVASPCSGHGYKFASVVGEILADLATGARPRFDLSPFAMTRPALAA